MLRLVALLFLIPTVALADVAGRATVIDGDTIEVQGERVRLAGIDAFERTQTCGEKSWPCGARATRWLTAILRGHIVRCDLVDTGAGPKSATCITGGPLTLNHLLVRLGLALADPDHGHDYVGMARRPSAGEVIPDRAAEPLANSKSDSK
jgi:endonuclease YncB( thermonuclease family)